MKHGLVFGKFLPPHKGHLHLIEHARKHCDKVTVMICSIKSEPIPGYLRHYWLKSIFPDLNVVHCTDENPQYPHEHPDFWNIWVNTVHKYTRNIDSIFTSENYGFEFAQRLGIEHVLVDLDRKSVPISGTLVRTNPYKHWDYIPDIVKPYFMKKVVLTGPESVGKTMTSQILANHFNTLWVPEYGREYTDNVGNNLTLRDFSHIASGQLELEQITAIRAGQKSKLLICDTDLIVTQIWSEIFLNTCPQWIIDVNTHHKYDLFLLMNTDIPWINDGTRNYRDIREWHFARIQKELDERSIKYVVISGNNFQQRTEQAIHSVNEIMKNVI